MARKSLVEIHNAFEAIRDAARSRQQSGAYGITDTRDAAIEQLAELGADLAAYLAEKGRLA